MFIKDPGVALNAETAQYHSMEGRASVLDINALRLKNIWMTLRVLFNFHYQVMENSRHLLLKVFKYVNDFSDGSKKSKITKSKLRSKI